MRRLVVLFLLAMPTAAHACGDTFHAGHGPLVVGDSVTYGAGPDLVHAGYRVDAVVCRDMRSGVSYLADTLRPRHRVTVALGSNGSVTRHELWVAWHLVRHLRLVTPRGPGGTVDPDARLMRRWARRRGVPVLDWARLSRGHAGWFVDGLHLTASGAAAFARMVSA